MLPRRDGSTVGTVIGVLVMAIAVVGTTFLDWTWSNPEGKLLPFAIGVVAAIGGAIVVLQRRRG